MALLDTVLIRPYVKRDGKLQMSRIERVGNKKKKEICGIFGIGVVKMAGSGYFSRRDFFGGR